VKAAEGEYRPGPYLLNDGWLSATAGSFWNFWQMGYDVQPYTSRSAMVEACLSRYSQTVAMCPGDHWQRTGNGGRNRITTSALSRFLRKPNDYQTASSFLLNLTRNLYSTGNAYGYVVRNDRTEITDVHLMREGHVRIATDGSIFYELGGNEIAEERFDLSVAIPARDVLHIPLHTPRHPLKGETPLMAAALDVAAGSAAVSQQLALFRNQNRSPYSIETDEKLTPEQATMLRQRLIEQTTGDNLGRPPIFSWGLKAKPLAQTAQDVQLAETMKMSDEKIALAFGIPLPILGTSVNGIPNTEALMQSWIASGLGFALNHIETALDKLFGLRSYPDDYVEFSTSSLLRSAFKDRMEGLARAVQGGIYAPNEARATEELAAAKDGDEPRVQQQVVPLSWQEPAPGPLQLPAPKSEDDGDAAERLYATLRSHDNFARH
jgi:HK97 family phage portal protein